MADASFHFPLVESSNAGCVGSTASPVPSRTRYASATRTNRSKSASAEVGNDTVESFGASVSRERSLQCIAKLKIRGPNARQNDARSADEVIRRQEYDAED